jgi:biopolymer transport protein ExbD
MAASVADNDGEIADINVVPLVDIILVVLIIFMVTAPAFVKPSVKVNLPQSGSADESPASELQIAIDLQGRVHVNGTEQTEEQLKAMAEAEVKRNPQTQAVVAADKDLPYWQVVQVLDWIKTAGIAQFSITTDRAVSAP